MQVEKRVPFGFRGDWGKVYKKYTNDEVADLNNNEKIEFENNYYVDIGVDVQFKPVGDITSTIEQPLIGLVVPVTYATFETTDAFWNDKIKEFSCVVDVGDVIKLFNKVWVVTCIREVAKYMPKKMSFYYCDVKSINL